MLDLKRLIVPLLFASSVFAQNNATLSLEDYISSYKQEEFEYDFKKNQEEYLKLRDSWIAPLQLQYRYSKTNPYGNEQTTKNASITMNQPIFRSGGIYYGIKFASASKKYQDYNVAVQKRKLIKDAIGLLIQIKQTQLQYQKQQLQVANSEIKLEQNKEEYLSGELDSGFLDNAIIQLNIVKQALYDIESSKQKLISQFKALSDINYQTAFIPHLENITQEEFLKENIILDLYQSDIEQNRYNHHVTAAAYLPALYLNGSYIKDENDNPVLTRPSSTTYYSYGFTLSMPLDFNTFRDIESAKLSELKASVVLEDKKRELIALYEQVEQNLKKIDQKIALAKENYNIYKKLLDDTKELFIAGEKTQVDVDLLQNSADMAQIDIKIYQLDKQLELLNLYQYYYKESSVEVQ